MPADDDLTNALHHAGGQLVTAAENAVLLAAHRSVSDRAGLLILFERLTDQLRARCKQKRRRGKTAPIPRVQPAAAPDPEPAAIPTEPERIPRGQRPKE